MADTIGLASSNITLAFTVYKACQALHNAVDGFRNAYHRIHVLSSDLEAFYLVLGTLQVILQDEASTAIAVERAMSCGLSRALEESMGNFQRITVFVQTLKAPGNDSPQAAWQRAKWTFKEKTIAGFRKELTACKMTLSMAISNANQ